MRNKPLASLKLSRPIAVVVLKLLSGGRRTFSPIVGVNLSYTHGYPEFYVNSLNIDTSGMGDDPHVSGHKDIVAIRKDGSADLGYTNLVKPLDDRQEPMRDGFNIPKARFLPGYPKKKLGAIRRHWQIDADLVQEGLQFEVRIWLATRSPTLSEIEKSYAREGRGEPLRIFVHSDNPNTVSLALYQGGPAVERSIDFQIDSPITSSSDGPVHSDETISMGGPRKTRKN